MDKQAQPGTVVPDSSWSWVICVGNMLVSFSLFATYRCFGVFYPSVMHEFEVDYAQVSLISGFFTGTMALGALFLVLVKSFGFKKVGLITCVLYSISLLAASQSTSIWMLIACCGMSAGFAGGLGVSVVMLTIPAYFNKHRSKAAGLTASAISIGALVLAPVISVMIDEFGWRGALLIISAFSLHATVGVSLYRPVATTDVKSEVSMDEMGDDTKVEPPTDPERPSRIKSVCDYTIFSRPIYILCFVASMTYWAAMVGSTFLIIPHGMETLGLSRTDASVLLTAQSAGDITGQLISGVIGDIKVIDRAILLGSATVVSTLMTYAITLCKEFVSLGAVAFLFGFSCAPFGGNYIVLYSEVFSRDKLTNAVSYDGFLSSVLTLPATYGLGVIIDVTGDVRVAYYACGGLMFIGSVCLFGIYFLKRRNE